MGFAIDRKQTRTSLCKKEIWLESTLVSHLTAGQAVYTGLKDTWSKCHQNDLSLTSAFHCMLALKLHVAEPGLPSGPEPHSTRFTQRCWLFSQFQLNNKTKNLKQAFWLVQVWSGADSWTNQLWPGRWSPIRKWRSNTWGVGEKQFPEEEREMMGRPPSPRKKKKSTLTHFTDVEI